MQYPEMISRAASQCLSEGRGIIERVTKLDGGNTDNWSEQDWKDYNFVAGVFVEPNTFEGLGSEEWEDMDFFYSKSDSDDNFVKSLKQFIQDGNDDFWEHVINLLLEVGY